MEYTRLVNLVGEDWAELLKGFMCPDADGKCPYDEIAAKLKEKYDNSAPVLPAKNQVFQAFKETPLSKVRVILLGVEPYNRKGFATGLAYSTDNEKLPISLVELYNGLEQDAYNGLDIAKTRRTGTLGKPMENDTIKTWASQGVLLLNAALTTEEKVDKAHIDIWRPFTEYIIANIWKVKRDLIFIGWGTYAKELLNYRSVEGTIRGVNCFNAFVLTAEHPLDAVAAKHKWQTDNFSKCNLIIKCNNLGAPIEW